MTKQKKNKEAEKEDSETPPAEQQVLMIPPDGELSPIALRLQCLALSKDVLEHQSHLSWETHKIVIDVSISDIIQGAKEFLNFVYDE